MSHSPNPKAARTIQRKAVERQANATLAEAARNTAKKWANRTLTEQDLLALFATIQKVDG